MPSNHRLNGPLPLRGGRAAGLCVLALACTSGDGQNAPARGAPGAGAARIIPVTVARAELGVGTLYRHFPTKDALLEVMVLERHRLILDEARAAQRATDPWDGFTSFVWRLAEMEAEDRAIADVLGDAQGRVDPTPFYAELSKLVRSLTRRAQAAGTMRKDVSAEDALLAVCTIGKAQPPPAPGNAESADAWRRLVRIILDGMRPPSTPL